MSIEELAELQQQYREHAEAHGAATQKGDYKSANKSHDELIAVLALILKAGSAGQVALRRLSQDTNEAVACWAATHCLTFDEPAALSVLERLSERTCLMGFDAKMVVQQWKNGQLVIPIR
jgi:hypothetical protein